MKLPYYYVGLASKRPVYCDIEATINSGKFVPFFTSLRKVNLAELSILDFSNLIKYINEQYKVDSDMELYFSTIPSFPGIHLMTHYFGNKDGCIGIKIISCINLTCGKDFIRPNSFKDEIYRCPHCKLSFMG